MSFKNIKYENLLSSSKSYGGICAILKCNFGRKELERIKDWIEHILKNTQDDGRTWKKT